MKKIFLSNIIKIKKKKIEFSIVTNLTNCESCIYEKNKEVSKNFKKYEKKVKYYFDNKKDGIIKDTNIFIENHFNPIKIFIVGAVHITQHLIVLSKELNLEIVIIDPRGYFASSNRFPNTMIINKWPIEAFKEINSDKNSALVALTHDPKIDDPAIQYAIKNNFFYIGALGSKKTHSKRCIRLKKSGFSKKQIDKIYGPIGIKLGGKSTPEIAFSIISQLILEINKKKTF